MCCSHYTTAGRYACTIVKTSTDKIASWEDEEKKYSYRLRLCLIRDKENGGRSNNFFAVPISFLCIYSGIV